MGDVSAKAVLDQDERYTYNNEATMHILAPYLPTSIHSIEFDGGKIVAIVYCGEDVAATAYCATYDVSGKMLIIESEALNGGEERTISFDGGMPYREVRVFVLDSNQKPLCAAKKQ